MKKKRLSSILLALCLTAALLPGGRALAAGTHVMNAANNWDIHTQLIEPRDIFKTVETEKTSVRQNPGKLDTTVVIHQYPELRLDGYRVIDANLKHGSTPDLSKITVAATTEVALLNDDDTAGTKTVTSGYINNTGLPFAVSWNGNGSEDCGAKWVYEPAKQVVKEASSTYKFGPVLTFYEPYYTITYDNMTEAEQKGLPTRYTITNEEQKITLPKAARPGLHFYGYSGPDWFDDRYNRTETDDSISYTWSYDFLQVSHNYRIEDVTIQANFVYGPTLTFHTDGGTLDGELVEAPKEPGRNSGTVDISGYKPTKAGYTFAGWSREGYDSFDTVIEGGQVDWSASSSNPTGGDIQLFALWKKDSTSPSPSPVPAKPQFRDVDAEAYYYDAVTWAVNHTPQITNGTGDDQFSPDATCTRAQVVTFLWRAMGQPEPASTENPFTDVAADAYYYKAVLWALEHNITQGTGETTFSPDATCTRAQVVTFLWRTEGEPGASTPAAFRDVPAGQYYTEAVSWAVGREITNGTGDDQFSPDATCTRGQIVTFLYRDLG